MHVAVLRQCAAAARTLRSAPGSGGLSAAPSEAEGRIDRDPASSIRPDTLAA